MHIHRPPIIHPGVHRPILVRLRPVRRQDPVVEDHIPLREDPSLRLLPVLDPVHVPCSVVPAVVEPEVHQARQLGGEAVQAATPRTLVRESFAEAVGLAGDYALPVVRGHVPDGHVVLVDTDPARDHAVVQDELAQRFDGQDPVDGVVVAQRVVSWRVR